jgi:hypothetical protein
MLPAVIKLRNNTGGRYTVALLALAVLIGAIAFSKRKTVSMVDTPAETSTGTATVAAAEI